jgi:hypothetical protein
MTTAKSQPAVLATSPTRSAPPSAPSRTPRRTGTRPDHPPARRLPDRAERRGRLVDEHGQVFDSRKPADSAATFRDLLVIDASVLPGAVVTHPTMTIVAQAIKTMDHALAAAP